jgi:hypothetical protein
MIALDRVREKGEGTPAENELLIRARGRERERKTEGN